MARKYHRELVSEKPTKDGRGTVITEKDVRCTGADCRHCESQRYSRRRPSRLDFMSVPNRDKSYSSVDDRLPTPYQFDFRPDPAAKQRRREKSSSDRDRYYGDGGGYTLSRSNSMRDATMPISIPRPAPRRSSSMYESDKYDMYYSDSARDSRSRPAIHQDSGHYQSGRRYSTSRQESARVPVGFYEVLESSRPSKYTSSGRRRSASPLDFAQKTEEYDPERRRLRPKSKPARVVQEAAPAVSYGASPLMSTFDAGSYGSHRTSDFSRGASLSTSPNNNNNNKSVHWGPVDDDPRRAQNEKIQNRKRRDSVSAGAGTGAETVKSILKTGPTTTAAAEAGAAPAVQPLSSDQYGTLYGGTADRDSRDMIEGLRKRISNYGVADDSHRYSAFDMPPRRFSGAWGEKASSKGRRAERFYDDRRESLYY